MADTPLKLVYEIGRPFCSWQEVDRATFYNPPQRQGSPVIEYRKRILVEATSEQIEEEESKHGND